MNTLLERLGLGKPMEQTKKRTGPHPFKLPISYVPKESLHTIEQNVVDDVELDKTMYPILVKSQSGFSQDIIPELHKYYTTNHDYLRDTQTFIQTVSNANNTDISEKGLRDIYNALYDDPQFLEKHSYMEWSIVEHMNHSSIYLQIIAALQLISPALSLMMPVFILIFPILLLLISGIKFTIASYIACLKEIARNHFIGRAIHSFSSGSIGYFLVTIGLYFFQIYQNCISCWRFYHMIHRVNEHMYSLREFVQKTITSMDTVIAKLQHLTSYAGFVGDVQLHRNRLQELYQTELQNITPITIFMTKIPNMGNLLRAYYQVHDSCEWSESIEYAFGFVGWHKCCIGLSQNIQDGFIGIADILEEEEQKEDGSTDHEEEEEEIQPKPKTPTIIIQKQYYPPLMNEPNCIKNDCCIDDNMIITGINASGKTTYLKTTLLNVIFTQQWGCGFYKTAAFKPYHEIHSYLNIPDTSARDSLFQAESRRCKDILDSIEKGGDQTRHFCIFDELYSGTNPDEACKSAYGFLRYLAKRPNVRFMLTTHYISVCKRLLDEKCESICYLQMEVKEGDDDNSDYIYTHKIVNGICEIQGGIQVLRKMDYPTELLDYIKM